MTAELGVATMPSDRASRRRAHLVRSGRTVCGHEVPEGVPVRRFTRPAQLTCPSCRRSRLFRDGDPLHVASVGGVLTCRGCGYSWKPRVERPMECPNCKARTGLAAIAAGGPP